MAGEERREFAAQWYPAAAEEPPPATVRPAAAAAEDDGAAAALAAAAARAAAAPAAAPAAAAASQRHQHASGAAAAAAAAAAADLLPPPRKPPPRKPRRAHYRLAGPRRAKAAARDVEALEQRAAEARAVASALEGRNVELRRQIGLMAGEFQALDLLVQFGGGGGGGGSGSGEGQPLPPAAAALLEPVGFGARAFRETLGLAYLRQQASLRQMGVAVGCALASSSDTGGSAGGSGSGENKAAPAGAAAATTATTATTAAVTTADFSAVFTQQQQQHQHRHHHQQQQDNPSQPCPDAIFRASVFGVLGASPQQAGAAIERLAAERYAHRPLGPRPLEAAVALFRDLAARAAILLRRLELLERERQEAAAAAAAASATATSAAADDHDDNEPLADVRRQIDDLAVETVTWHAIMLKHHPEALDELVVVRLDDERSPPVRHDDHDLQSRLGRAAVRAARLSPAQHAQLKAAFDAFTRQMAEPVLLMRRAGQQLQRHLEDPALLLAEEPGQELVVAAAAAAAPPPSSSPSSSRQLLETIDRCAAACSLHRVIIGLRTYSIVTPLQFAGLVVDCYPFLMRPASLLAAFVSSGSGGGAGARGVNGESVGVGGSGG
jgi:hypothetical protein